MLLKPDQERVQILLKDTMTLLCKNGLNFDCKFRIEALVGITLDDKSVCLMKFDELVELQKTDGLDETQTDDDEKSSNRKRRKKIKKEKADLSKEDGDKSDGSDTGDDVLSNSGTDITSTSFNSSMPPPQSHHHHGVKRKLDDGEQDLIVVKEEQSSLWDKSQDYGVQDHDGSFASSSDMAQDMVGSPDGVVWSPLSSVSQGMASGHSRTATVTSSAKDGTSHMPGDSTQQMFPFGQPRSYRNYSPDQLMYGLKLCEQGISIRRAAHLSGVPRRTLSDRMSKMRRNIEISAWTDANSIWTDDHS